MDQVASTGTEQARDMLQVVRASILPSGRHLPDAETLPALYALDSGVFIFHKIRPVGRWRIACTSKSAIG